MEDAKAQQKVSNIDPALVDSVANHCHQNEQSITIDTEIGPTQRYDNWTTAEDDRPSNEEIDKEVKSSWRILSLIPRYHSSDHDRDEYKY